MKMIKYEILVYMIEIINMIPHLSFSEKQCESMPGLFELDFYCFTV